jgi:hypothetical protein
MQTKHFPLNRVGRLANRRANVLIGLVVAIFGFHAADAWYAVRAQNVNQMDAIAALMKQTLDTYLVSKEASLLSLADSIQRGGGLGDLQKVRRLLSDYKSHRSDVSLSFVSDLNGQVLATSTSTELTGLPSIADQTSYQVFLKESEGQTGMYVGRPQLGKLRASWNVSLRVFLRDPQGKPLAVISAVIPSETLAAFWSDSVTGSTTSIGILRDDNYLLARYPLPPSANLADVLGKPRRGELVTQLTTVR